jgi:acyl-CoA synthetase (NDP forming)
VQGSLDYLLKAKSVAIVGASERGRWQKKIFLNLREYGYEGEVFPINPNRPEVWGEHCYPDLASLPNPVDHALVMLPADPALEFLEQEAKRGLKAATIYAAGIGEGDDPQSRARGKKLREICEQSGLRVCGPNCMGVMSLREKLFLYPNSELCTAPVGSAAVLFQSGGSLQFWTKTAIERGLSFSYLVSSGNELDVDTADYINFFVDDPNTSLIIMFMEGVRRPGPFLEAAQRALAARKPIVILKVGRTEQARAAAYSHTGAIAGDYDVFRAMCDRYGIVLCDSLDDMLETALALQSGRLPTGSGVGIVASSGGILDLLHDYADEEQVVLPALAAPTTDAISSLVTREVSVKNPLDAAVTGFANPDALVQICKLMVDDPAVDMLAVSAVLPSDDKSAKPPEPLRDLAASTGKPVIAFGRMSYMVNDFGRSYQKTVGMPFLQGLRPTLRALHALSFYSSRAGGSVPVLPAPTGRSSNLDPARIGKVLKDHDVPPPRSETAASPAEAARMAETVGFPVALKLLAAGLNHKTEAGAVILGIKSQEEVERAAQELGARADKFGIGDKVEGFLVQEMVEGVEVVVGVREDMQFGPVLMVGAGGTLVELVRDVALALLPVGEPDIRQMLEGLRISRLLAGFRGQAPADVDALVRAVLGLARFYLAHRMWLTEVEINPLIVRREHEGVAAVDIRVRGRQGLAE